MICPICKNRMRNFGFSSYHFKDETLLRVPAFLCKKCNTFFKVN